MSGDDIMLGLLLPAIGGLILTIIVGLIYAAVDEFGLRRCAVVTGIVLTLWFASAELVHRRRTGKWWIPTRTEAKTIEAEAPAEWGR